MSESLHEAPEVPLLLGEVAMGPEIAPEVALPQNYVPKNETAAEFLARALGPTTYGTGCNGGNAMIKWSLVETTEASGPSDLSDLA